MKNITTVLVLILVGFAFSSFTNNTDTISPKESITQDDLIAKGKTLFNTKTCNACHTVDAKLVGPSLKTIATAYKVKKVDLIKFFKGESKAIVDPAMAAIMDANVQSITKPMKDSDLKALSAYIMSTIK